MVSYFYSVQSLNRKLRNNSNELELMRNQITSTGTIISDISLSLADLNIQSEIVEQVYLFFVSFDTPSLLDLEAFIIPSLPDFLYTYITLRNIFINTLL